MLGQARMHARVFVILPSSVYACATCAHVYGTVFLSTRVPIVCFLVHVCMLCVSSLFLACVCV